MTFEYKIPSDQTTVKRLFLADTLQADRFSVCVAGEQVAEVDYGTARRFWLGKIDLAELVKDE